mmetsp:Transcript_35577/g.65374  ORF Transcript_35577/g.65374 Transcript_35577/m.65374 type:complete len:605 (+) Transcript_35577:2-1816(+)
MRRFALRERGTRGALGPRGVRSFVIIHDRTVGAFRTRRVRGFRGREGTSCDGAAVARAFGIGRFAAATGRNGTSAFGAFRMRGFGRYDGPGGDGASRHGTRKVRTFGIGRSVFAGRDRTSAFSAFGAFRIRGFGRRDGPCGDGPGGNGASGDGMRKVGTVRLRSDGGVTGSDGPSQPGHRRISPGSFGGVPRDSGPGPRPVFLLRRRAGAARRGLVLVQRREVAPQRPSSGRRRPGEAARRRPLSGGSHELRDAVVHLLLLHEVGLRLRLRGVLCLRCRFVGRIQLQAQARVVRLQARQVVRVDVSELGIVPERRALLLQVALHGAQMRPVLLDPNGVLGEDVQEGQLRPEGPLLVRVEGAVDALPDESEQRGREARVAQLADAERLGELGRQRLQPSELLAVLPLRLLVRRHLLVGRPVALDLLRLVLEPGFVPGTERGHLSLQESDRLDLLEGAGQRRDHLVTLFAASGQVGQDDRRLLAVARRPVERQGPSDGQEELGDGGLLGVGVFLATGSLRGGGGPQQRLVGAQVTDVPRKEPAVVLHRQGPQERAGRVLQLLREERPQVRRDPSRRFLHRVRVGHLLGAEGRGVVVVVASACSGGI